MDSKVIGSVKSQRVSPVSVSFNPKTATMSPGPIS